MTDCVDVRRALSVGDLDERARAHVDECEACAALAFGGGALANRLGAVSAEDSVPEGLMEETWERLEEDRGPRSWLASRPTSVRQGVAVGLVVTIGLATVQFAPRGDLATYPAERMAAFLVVIGALLLASIVLGLRSMHRPNSSSWVYNGLASIAVISLVALYMLPEVGGLEDGPEHQLLKHAAPCVFFGLAVGVPVYALGRLLDRGGRALTQMLSATAAGLAANLSLQLHCAFSPREHLLVGHASVLLGFLGLAAAIMWIERRAAQGDLED